MRLCAYLQLSTMLAGLAIAPALAQGAGDDQAVPEIVVTAERRATRLQDTPIAISALAAEQLQAQGVRSINDLAAFVPNLTATTGPQGSADANFFVRGVGQFDFIVTNDPGVGVYVDGVYLGRTVGAMLDSADNARVEVLRGPQGTLFGRNTLGGAISITSVQPKLDVTSLDARASYGSRNRIDVDATANLALGDKAALRVSGVTRNQEGWATNALTGEKFGRTRRNGVRGSLLLEPTDRLKITLAADWTRDTSNPAPSVNLAINPNPPFSFIFPADAARDRSDDFYTIFASNRPDARNTTWGLSGTLEWELGGATLTSVTAWRSLDGFSTSDPDGTGYRLYDQQATTRQTQFSQELRLGGTALDDRLTWLAGLYHFRESADQVLALCFAPITPVPAARFNACNTWTQGNDQTTTSWAAFGQLRYKLADALSFTLGGRYTWENKDIISNQFFDFRPAGFSPAPGVVVPGMVAPIVSNLPGSLSFRQFTPKIGVEYQRSRDLLLFASYARGFRSGGFNGRLIAPQASVPTYAPDTNDTFELGVKSDLLDRTLRLNVTGFYSRYRDIQQTITDPAVQFRVANAGDAELYGLEAEITARPGKDTTINLGIGYTASRFTNVPPAVGPVAGNRLPFSPEFTVAAGIAHDIRSSAGTFTPRIDWRFQSRTFFTAFNLPLEQQAPYGLLSARVTWVEPKERFSIALFGENLTDARYFTFGQNALGNQGVAFNYLGRPREFGISFGAKF